MPMDKSRYPSNWKAISRRIREREQWRCKWCGAEHGQPHPVTGSKVILTVAHIDNPDPMDCRDENLAALCQKCHLGHDRVLHMKNAAHTRYARIIGAGQLTMSLVATGEPDQKWCRRCKQWKQRTAFTAHRLVKDGLQTWCRDCKNADRRARRAITRSERRRIRRALKFEDALVRFWEHVEKQSNGCWLWTGTVSARYGVLSVCGVTTKAHRFSWTIHNGPVSNDLFICHNCPTGDNPLCVNPDHLFPGTAADNIADMWAKGRGNSTKTFKTGKKEWKAGAHYSRLYPELAPRGERNGRAKLTEADVRFIREQYAAGSRQIDLAERFLVKQSQISAITLRKTWKHVV